jgi:hypothetical protein
MGNKTKMMVKRLKEDTAYQEFFKKAMKKFNISTPADLKDPAKKKDFFDYVDKNYKGKSESMVKEGYFASDGTDSGEIRNAKKALANWFNNSIEIGMTGQPLKRASFDILYDLIDDYATAFADDYLDNYKDEKSF